MDNGFVLERPTYSPREFALLYRAHVGRISYVTVLSWIELYNNTGGFDGIKAHASPTGRYRITAGEVERVLLAAGARKAEEMHE